MENTEIAIQSLLFNHDFNNVDSWMSSVNSSVKILKLNNENVVVNVYIGDCSATPCLSDLEVQSFRDNYRELDMIAFHFFDENMGSAKGHTTLSKESNSKYLMTINPDTVLSPSCLNEQFKLMGDENTGISEAVQIPLEHPKTFDLETGETSWASTCCALIRREAFNKVGGFDFLHFFLHCDDVDFSWMVRLAGYKVRVAPKAIIFHDHGFDDDNKYIATAPEIRFSAIGALMLFAKWNRPDILKETLSHFREHPDIYAQVLQDWDIHKKNGTLPEPISNAISVAEFIDGAFATHRW